MQWTTIWDDYIIPSRLHVFHSNRCVFHCCNALIRKNTLTNYRGNIADGLNIINASFFGSLEKQLTWSGHSCFTLLINQPIEYQFNYSIYSCYQQEYMLFEMDSFFANTSFFGAFNNMRWFISNGKGRFLRCWRFIRCIFLNTLD